jgi:hypothetical protein
MTLVELLVVLVPFGLGFAGGLSLTAGQPIAFRIGTGLLTGCVTVALWIRILRWRFRDDDGSHE